MTEAHLDHPNRPQYDPRISLGNIAVIVTIITAVVTVTGYVGSIDSKVAANTVRIAYIEDRLNRDSTAYTEIKRDNTARLDRIENKVDEVIKTIQTNQREWKK